MVQQDDHCIDTPFAPGNLCGGDFALLGLLISLELLVKLFVFDVEVPGYISIALGVLVFSGIQLLSLGLLGKYVEQIFQNSQLSTFVTRDLHKRQP